jgi:hypothetical protein
MNIIKEKDIFNVEGMAESIRYSDYKSIENAIAEIIDNSIEANAYNISILFNSAISPKTGKKEINSIGFLDDGFGMEPDLLHRCLSFGDGTRKERKGMGRFGVGLAQASLYACTRVEVYSWVDDSEPRVVYLDHDLMKKGEQVKIEFPKVASIPSEYFSFYKSKKLKSGTLVLWKNIDKSPVKQTHSLMSRLEKYLGQVYRYFLHKDRVRLELIDNENKAHTTIVKPRDPLFLMENDYFLAASDLSMKKAYLQNKSESVFERYLDDSFDGIVEVKYYNNSGQLASSNVNIKASIVKEKFYNSELTKRHGNLGATEVGKYLKDYAKISILRAGRELDFDKFGFFEEINSPYHRWWGLEISFGPELDEVFNVSNNKQKVELKKPTTKEIQESQLDEVTPLWEALNNKISPIIKAMTSINQQRQKGSRNKNENSSSVDVVSQKHNEFDNIPEKVNETIDSAIGENNSTPTNRIKRTNLYIDNDFPPITYSEEKSSLPVDVYLHGKNIQIVVFKNNFDTTNTDSIILDGLLYAINNNYLKNTEFTETLMRDFIKYFNKK